MYRGNDKADKLCKLAINSLREVDITQQDNSDQEVQLCRIPNSDIRMIMRSNDGLANHTPYYQHHDLNSTSGQQHENHTDNPHH